MKKTQNQMLFDEAEKLWHTFNEICDRIGGYQWRMFLEADKDPEWQKIDNIQPIRTDAGELEWLIRQLKQRIMWVRKWQYKHIPEMIEEELKCLNL